MNKIWLIDQSNGDHKRAFKLSRGSRCYPHRSAHEAVLIEHISTDVKKVLGDWFNL